MRSFDQSFDASFGGSARGTGEAVEYIYLVELYPWQATGGLTYGEPMPFDSGPLDALPGDEEQPPGSTAPLYYADRGYLTPPDDDEAPRRLYGGRLEGFSVARRLPISPSDGARVAATYGTLTLRNDDGALDDFPNTLAIAGRRVWVRRLVQGDYLAHAVTVFDGVGVAWEAGSGTMGLTVRDNAALADLPLLPLYGGTGGKDGPPEWAGRPIPGCFGIVRWLPLDFYDTAYGLARAHFRRNHGIPGLWDKGGAYAFVADYATEAALKAATLTGGQYATCVAEGLVRAVPAGAAFAGQVTADVYGDAEGGYVDTHAGIAQRGLEIGGMSAIVNAASFSAMSTTYPDAAGFAWTDQITVADAVSEIMGGIAAWWGGDQEGWLGCDRLGPPAVVADDELTASDILDLEPAPLPASVSPAVWRVTANCRRCHSVQGRSQLLDTADEEIKAFAEKEWRTATPAADTLVLSRYQGNAQELTINSGFDDPGPAAALAAYLLGLYPPGRGCYAPKVPLTVSATADLGVTERVTWPRYGLGDGKNLVIVALPEDIGDRNATVIYWG